MRLRGAYIKVTDLEKALTFWKGFLNIEPKQVSPDGDYFEFLLENGRLGISLNNYGDKYLPSSAVPVFQMNHEQAKVALDKVLSLGGKLDYNGIEVEKHQCIVCLDPFGNEFEFNALPEST